MPDRRSTSPRLTPWRRQVIDQALDDLLMLDAAERQEPMRAIERRCPRLSRVLSRLLEASLTPTRFLKPLMGDIERAVGGFVEQEPVSLPAGTRIGPWRIVEPAGSGGMGTVYRAERADDAFDMDVAIKLIRLNRSDFNERLQIERRMLARLDHPNIARLIDGGQTLDGEAYLVMEWVPGEDLASLGKTKDRTDDWKLACFSDIAAAVAHAHQRQVVHGDIKPANVRVMADGRVRLLDFGVARLIAGEEGDSDKGLRAVTPAFSAPEQMAGAPVSTLSDVWSLGALLYWMLTGERPGRMAAAEVRARLAECCERNHELSAIVLKSCDQSPDERYASVPELISDVQRYRERHPVHAVSWTRRYLMSRFIGRHRLAVAASTAGVLLICSALVGALWQAQVATLERDRAQLEVEKTRQVSEFLIDLFDHADPATARGEDLLAVDLVEQGVLRINALAGADEVQVELLQVLGRVYRSLGRYADAERLARRSLALIDESPHDDRQHARVLNLIGTILTATGDAVAADQYHQHALAAIGSKDSHDRLLLLSDWGGALARAGGRAAEALPVFEEGLALADRLDYEGREVSKIHQSAGVALFHMGRPREARDRFELAVEGKRDRDGADHPDTLSAISNLATTHALLAEYEAAEALYFDLLEIQRRILGEDHPNVGNTLHAIGSMYWRQRDVEAAERWWRKGLEVKLDAYDEHHPEVATARNALALAARENGDFDRAEALYQQALEAFEMAYPEGHIRIPMVLNNLAGVHSSRGDLDRAIELTLEAKALQIKLVGETHDHVAHSQRNLAGLSLNNGDSETALGWARKAQATYMAVFDDTDHPGYQATMELLERIHEALAE